MIDKLLKMTKGKANLNKYKGLMENMKKNLLKNLSKGLLDDDVEIPALPFKVPSFNIAGVKIDLNDKERINEHVGKVRDVLKSDQAQSVLKLIGLGWFLLARKVMFYKWEQISNFDRVKL